MSIPPCQKWTLVCCIVLTTFHINCFVSPQPYLFKKGFIDQCSHFLYSSFAIHAFMSSFEFFDVLGLGEQVPCTFLKRGETGRIFVFS